MDEKKMILLIMTFNTLIFFFINIDVSIDSANGPIALWSWTIWGYMFYNLIFLMDYLSRYYLSKKNSLLACANYFLQIMFYLLFVYAYVLNYLNINRSTILYFIVVVVFLELLLSFSMKSGNNLYGTEEDKLETNVIKEFIFNTLMRHHKSTSDENIELRMMNSILNIITLVYIFIVPIIIRIMIDVFVISYLAPISISICIFLVLNFAKYKMCKLSAFKYLFDMLTFSISFIYYIWLYQYVGADGFIKLYAFIALLSPYLLTSYKIAQIYYYGRKTTNE